jgi:hypothetical protein
MRDKKPFRFFAKFKKFEPFVTAALFAKKD